LKIVVDTSVWIDFFNGQATKEVIFLRASIREDKPIHLTPTIIQEILQGIRDDKMYNEILSLLESFPLISPNPLNDAIGAANLYRELRKKGVTIRKSNDYLIGHICIRSESHLLFRDRDFETIAKHTNLKTITFPNPS
jgi:predicted nucleic acid-binding protein